MNGKVSQVDLLARTLDAASLRHRAIASNVANVNTPDYKRVEVSFEEDLVRSARRGIVRQTRL